MFNILFVFLLTILLSAHLVIDIMLLRKFNRAVKLIQDIHVEKTAPVDTAFFNKLPPKPATDNQKVIFQKELKLDSNIREIEMDIGADLNKDI